MNIPWKIAEPEPLGYPTDAELQTEAVRQCVAAKNKIDRKVVPNYEVIITTPPTEEEIETRKIGLRGQRAVARYLHIHMPLEQEPDQGRNLESKTGVPINVSTRRIPPHKVLPDVLFHVETLYQPELAIVLCAYEEGYEPHLVGWCWENDAREKGSRVWLPNTRHESYLYDWRRLKDMAVLWVTQPWRPLPKQTSFV